VLRLVQELLDQQRLSSVAHPAAHGAPFRALNRTTDEKDSLRRN
jgi:hypothetical protein